MPGATPNRGYPFPLYTDPQDFPQNIEDLANAIDADVQALDDAIQAAYNRDSVMVSGPVGGTQAIPTGAAGATVTYSTEEYDNAGMANLGVTNDRITYQQAGFYLVTAHVTFAAGPNTTFGIFAALTSTGTLVAQPAVMSRNGHNTRPTNLTVTGVEFANSAGDTTRLVVGHNAGVNVNVTRCSLTATLLS
jgi:hypothetical protein